MIIIPKRSITVGSVPTADQLQVGEIAINLADEKLYVKNSAGEVVLLGGSELYTLIAEARDHVDSSLAAHDSSSNAHSDIRDAITLTYSKGEDNKVYLKDAKSEEDLTLYPQTLNTEVLDEKGVSLDKNLSEIREEIDMRNISYSDSDIATGIPENMVINGTSLVLGDLTIPEEETEILETDTIATAFGKLIKMIKG